MTDELEKKILQWLAGEGYPLEMRVARAFNKRKWETSQSVVYEGETKSREIDVLAMKRHGLPQKEGELWRAFEFVVVTECKSQTSKPWLVFTTEANAGPSLFSIESRAANTFGRRLLDHISTAEAFESFSFFNVDQRTGYSAVRAFESGNQDGAYAAISGVIDATAHWCNFEANKYTARCRLVFPVIVTPAPLFECYLDEDNKERVTPRSSITLFADNSVLGGQYAVVEIVNESAVDGYLEKLEELFDYVWKTYQDPIAKSFGDLPLARGSRNRTAGPAVSSVGSDPLRSIGRKWERARRQNGLRGRYPHMNASASGAMRVRPMRSHASTYSLRVSAVIATTGSWAGSFATRAMVER